MKIMASRGAFNLLSSPANISPWSGILPLAYSTISYSTKDCWVYSVHTDVYGLLLYNEYYTTPIQNWEGAYYEVGNNKVARENWSMYFWEGKKGSFFLKECLETHKIEFVTQHVIKSACMATVDYFSLRKPLISCSITIQEIGKETEFNHGTVLFSALSKVQQRIQSKRDFRKKG